jgi:L-seryl-tRNA(Ser) seleniumtransferase
MKVNKEELVSMWIALERFMEMDMDAEYKRWQMQVAWLDETLNSIEGLRTESYIPERPNNVPTLKLSFDSAKISATGFEIQSALLDGSPSVAIAKPREDGFNITTWMLKAEQLETVALRVKEELQKVQV